MELPAAYTTIELTHTFPVERDRVFRAFTTPVDLARWIWGADARNTQADFVAEAGRGFTIYTDNRWEDREARPRAGMRGLVVACVSGARLVYTLRWDADVGYNRGELPMDEVVTVTFHDEAGGTRIEYRHQGVPDDGVSAKLHAEAIASTFRDLEALLTAED